MDILYPDLPLSPTYLNGNNEKIFLFENSIIFIIIFMMN